MQDVYITGIGFVTPLGNRPQKLWSALLAGKSAVGPITKMDVSHLPVRIAAEIPPQEPDEFLSSQELSSCRPSTAVGLSAARRALADAGLLNQQQKSVVQSMDFFLGSTSGQLFDHEQSMRSLWQKTSREFPFTSEDNFKNQTTYGMVRDIAVRLGLQAQACMNTNACTAGAYAVAWGADSIRSGQQSRVLCGGVDLISESILSGFYNLKLMADEKSRPFDIQQQGLVLGEAAAMLVLESEASWQARRVQPWAKLEGSGWFHEAYHMIAPEPQGLGRQHSMRRALSRTGRSVEDVGCVIANGYGTKKNDMAELEALQAIFGKTRTPITTLRPLLGHSRGAESVLDVAIAVLILQNQKIPAITNLEQPYPEYTLQLVKDKPQDAEVRVCLVNNFGFGGNTISTLVGEAGTEKRSHV